MIDGRGNRRPATLLQHFHALKSDFKPESESRLYKRERNSIVQLHLLNGRKLWKNWQVLTSVVCKNYSERRHEMRCGYEMLNFWIYVSKISGVVVPPPISSFITKEKLLWNALKTRCMDVISSTVTLNKSGISFDTVEKVSWQ